MRLDQLNITHYLYQYQHLGENGIVAVAKRDFGGLARAEHDERMGICRLRGFRTERYAYRSLKEGEVVQPGDELDCCRNPWRDYPVWRPAPQEDIGTRAPDPRYVSHRQYRRKIDEEPSQKVQLCRDCLDRIHKAGPGRFSELCFECSSLMFEARKGVAHGVLARARVRC